VAAAPHAVSSAVPAPMPMTLSSWRRDRLVLLACITFLQEIYENLDKTRPASLKNDPLKPHFSLGADLYYIMAKCASPFHLNAHLFNYLNA
jgi:hypothetical protein